MSNLEQSIMKWRQRMLTAGIQTPVPLGELELHLRDEIDRQRQLGLAEDEAFQMAVRNIGPAPVLQSEFKKCVGTEELRNLRAGQMWLGAILGFGQLLLIGAVLFNSEMNFGQKLSGLGAIATSLLLVGAGGMCHRFFPVISDRRRRLAISFLAGAVPACLWSLVFAHYYLAGHEFPFGQWLASVLWTACPPLAVYLGIIVGFETAARKDMAAAM